LWWLVEAGAVQVPELLVMGAVEPVDLEPEQVLP
jgi:hypothetical protein